MNDAQLSEQLRALRQPAPDAGFEARLQQALWREAQALRAERALAQPAPARRRRLSRWSGRLLGAALVLGATAAAAAAGGVWSLVSGRALVSPAIEAGPASGAAAGAKRRAAATRAEPQAPETDPVAPAQPAEAAELSPAAAIPSAAVPAAAIPAAPAASPAHDRRPAARPEGGV